MEITKESTSKFSGPGNTIKILQHIKSLGCSRDDIVVATFRVYMDLFDAKNYHQCDYFYHPQLNHLYLKVRKTKDDDEKIVVPISSGMNTSFEELTKFQNSLETPSIKIAIWDASSVIMYYDLINAIQ